MALVVAEMSCLWMTLSLPGAVPPVRSRCRDQKIVLQVGRERIGINFTIIFACERMQTQGVQTCHGGAFGCSGGCVQRMHRSWRENARRPLLLSDLLRPLALLKGIFEVVFEAYFDVKWAFDI